jgi:mRNA interferase MazF
VNAGDIHWVELPSANGREQQGRRPAVIAQDDAYGGRLPTVLVIPISSTRAALRFAGTASILATPKSGLRVDSVALVFQLRAIDRNRLGSRIGAVTNDEMRLILDELDRLTGRSSPLNM